MTTPLTTTAPGTHLALCQCCALKLVNDDESACRDYLNHTHPSVDVPAGTALTGFDPLEHTSARHLDCDGCGEPIEAFGLYWLAETPAI